MVGGENENNGKPVKKGGLFKKIMLWSAGGLIVLTALASILPKKDDAPSVEATNAPDVVAEEVAAIETAESMAPPAELSLTEYLAQCQGIAEEDFTRNCMGKQVVWTLSFSAGMEDPRVLMNRPGDYSTNFLVSFNELPDWGSRGSVSWTGRRVSVAGTIAVPDGGIVLENARVVEDESWRDRAVEMAKADERYLDAIWATGNISFWVAMANTGRNWDFEAQAVCKLLWRAGRPADFSVIVTVLDAARIQQQEELAKARCSS